MPKWHRVELGHHARVAHNHVIDVRAPPIMMEAFRVLHDVRILIVDAVVHHMQHLASRTSVGGTQWHALYAANTCPWCSSEHVVHTSIELVTAEEPR